MSLFLTFASQEELKDMPLKVAQARTRTGSTLNPILFDDATLDDFATILWDYHFDEKRRQQFTNKAEFRLALQTELVPIYAFSLDLTELPDPFFPQLKYPGGDDGHHDAAHPERVDNPPVSLTYNSNNGKISASIPWLVYDVDGITILSSGTRTWTVDTTIATENAAYKAGLLAHEDLGTRELSFEVIRPNFRSSVDSNVVSEADADPVGEVPYKNKRIQIHSALLYGSDSFGLPLYLFKDDVQVFGVWLPIYQTPALPGGDPFPEPREDDYRLGIGTLGDPPTLPALPGFSIAVYIDDPAFTAGDSAHPQPLLFSNPTGSATTASVALSPFVPAADHVIAWTDGDGYPQVATAHGTRVAYAYKFTWSQPTD